MRNLISANYQFKTCQVLRVVAMAKVFIARFSRWQTCLINGGQFLKVADKSPKMRVSLDDTFNTTIALHDYNKNVTPLRLSRYRLETLHLIFVVRHGDK